jgi:hypothetical protein
MCRAKKLKPYQTERHKSIPIKSTNTTTVTTQKALSPTKIGHTKIPSSHPSILEQMASSQTSNQSS